MIPRTIPRTWAPSCTKYTAPEESIQDHGASLRGPLRIATGQVPRPSIWLEQVGRKESGGSGVRRRSANLPTFLFHTVPSAPVVARLCSARPGELPGELHAAPPRHTHSEDAAAFIRLNGRRGHRGHLSFLTWRGRRHACATRARRQANGRSPFLVEQFEDAAVRVARQPRDQSTGVVVTSLAGPGACPHTAIRRSAASMPATSVPHVPQRRDPEAHRADSIFVDKGGLLRRHDGRRVRCKVGDRPARRREVAAWSRKAPIEVDHPGAAARWPPGRTDDDFRPCAGAEMRQFAEPRFDRKAVWLEPEGLAQGEVKRRRIRGVR